MKRSSLTLCILVVFVTWNVTTYFFLAYTRPNNKVEGRGVDLDERVARLKEQLQEQVASHEQILQQLDDARRQLQAQMMVTEKSKPEEKNPGQAADRPVEKPVEELAEALIPRIDLNTLVIPVLVIACNRPSINRNLDQLIKYRPSPARFPIIVSQDCGHAGTADVVRSYGNQVTHLQHPDLSDISLSKKETKFKGYYKIARHYKWALNQVFHTLNHDTVIIVEDDLDIAPDFFEYFAATYPILVGDSSLWCVSAWNDNGKEGFVQDDPELLYRTDFFPGLGWMLTKKTWMELEDKWPVTFWDDWMRHPDQRRDRSCIRPEIPRTSTFGKVGVSKGQYFEKHLKFIHHNTHPVQFTHRNLTYLHKSLYDEAFVKEVYNTPLLTTNQVVSQQRPDLKKVRVQYNDRASFKAQAKLLGIMDDFKSGVPRAGYRGVVSLMNKGRRVYLAPPATWTAYDPTWS